MEAATAFAGRHRWLPPASATAAPADCACRAAPRRSREGKEGPEARAQRGGEERIEPVSREAAEENRQR